MRLLVAAFLAAIALTAAPAAHAEPQDLAGKVIVIDPGHQLGNSNPRFQRFINQTRFNGSIVKGCNTSGTATNAGFPEATFAWRVAKRLKRMLQARGATVHLTRKANTYSAWGPCVWDRARLANRLDADALISIHADGAPAGKRGFFAIVPARLREWTDDIASPSRRLGRAMIDGMTAAGAPPSNYISNQLSVRSDQSTLNFSDVPAVIVELGNMRDAREAARMASAKGQAQYARWLEAGILRYFGN